MFELFSDIYADRGNRFTRMDARAKLFAAAVTLAAVIAAPGPALPLAVWVLCVIALLSIRIQAGMIALRMAPALSMAAVLLVLNMFMLGTTPVAHLGIGGLRLAVMQEGLHQGIRLGARVMGATGVLLFLGFTTPAHLVFQGLRWYGAPESWVELALSVYRQIFTLIDAASDMYAAQRVRLGYADARRAVGSGGVLAGSVLLRSMEQATRTHEAMLARGYTGNTVLGPPPRLAKGDAAIAILWIVGVLSAFGVFFKIGI